MSKSINEFVKKSLKPRYIIFGIIFIIYIGFVIFKIPELCIDFEFIIVDPKERLDVIKDLRNAIIQIHAGILAIIGIYLTWRRTNALDNQNKINEKNNDNNLTLQQFSKASELLKDESIAARLSGIYLFESIMNKSQEYHWPVIELLSAYVREKRDNKNYDVDLVSEEEKKKLKIEKDENGNECYIIANSYEKDKDDNDFLCNIKYYYRVPVEKDIQAILKVLGKRVLSLEKYIDEDGETNLNELILKLMEETEIFKFKKENNKEEDYYLSQNYYEIKRKLVLIDRVDFRNINLYKAEIAGFHFENTDCSEAHFKNAICNKSHFENAKCYSTHFENANCESANYEDAYCSEAHFENANCWFAHFEHADLNGTYFVNADCSFSHFKITQNLNSKQLSYTTSLARVHGLSKEMKQEIVKLNPDLKDDLFPVKKNNENNAE